MPERKDDHIRRPKVQRVDELRFAGMSAHDRMHEAREREQIGDADEARQRMTSTAPRAGQMSVGAAASAAEAASPFFLPGALGPSLTLFSKL